MRGENIMFETIAMICYLSLVEPQEFEAPTFQENPMLTSFTGGADEPEDNPKKTGKDNEIIN